MSSAGCLVRDKLKTDQALMYKAPVTRQSRVRPLVSTATMSDSEDEDTSGSTSAVVPLGPYAHSCGYCGSDGERSAAKSAVNAATLDALHLLAAPIQERANVSRMDLYGSNEKRSFDDG